MINDVSHVAISDRVAWSACNAMWHARVPRIGLNKVVVFVLFFCAVLSD